MKTCEDFENKLIKLLWRKRHLWAPATVASGAHSASASYAHLTEKAVVVDEKEVVAIAEREAKQRQAKRKAKRRGCKWGLGYFVSTQEDAEKAIDGTSDRPIRLLAPFYSGLSMGMSICRSLLVLRCLMTLMRCTSLHWQWNGYLN